MSLLHTVLLIVFIVNIPTGIIALDNGLAVKPQMGWNSWNHFGCNIQETLIRSTADSVISTGLAKAGYIYVNLDDCWASSRDSSNHIVPDPKGFPSGMKALGDYIHGLGLKFGVYSDAGSRTCAGRPGSLGYEVNDANSYASWGVDYLKYDNCNANTDPKIRYPPMRDALNATGRSILFSLCEWGNEDPATWAPEVGNSWRTTGDIGDNWNSMIGNLVSSDRWWNYSGPSHWNDPDMLEVGNGGMTTAEYQAHFSLWCLVKSPLLIGCDITKMSTDTLNILTNAEVIALSQDDLGVQGHRIVSQGTSDVWSGPLAAGKIGVVLLNRGTSAANITVTFTGNLGLSPSATVTIRDLVAHRDLGSFTDSYSAMIPSHASQTLLLTPQTAAGQEPVNNIYELYQRHPEMKKILHSNPKWITSS